MANFVNDVCLILPEKKERLGDPLRIWIDHFSNNLNTILRRQLKRDLRLETFVPGTKSQFSFLEEYAASLIILEDSFRESKPFMNFLEALNETIEQKREIRIEPDRILKLLLSAGARELSSRFLNYFSQADFYHSAGDLPGELLDIQQISYWNKLLDTSALIRDAVTRGKQAQFVPDQEGALVYLASVTGDQQAYRDILRRELIQHGHRVEPEIDTRFIPDDPGAYIISILERSKIAVHLLGNQYGELFAESGLSLPEYQMNAVTGFIDKLERDQASLQGNLLRLIWISPEIAPADEQQKAFLGQIRQNIEKFKRTEIIQAPLELFKSILLKRLRQIEESGRRAVRERGKDKKRIYIINDMKDEEQAKSLLQKFEGAGVSTSMIDFSGGQSNLINIHKENLVRCDAALILYGHDNRFWLSSKVKDLLKAPGYGREAPLVAKGLMISGRDDLKDMKLPEDFMLMKGSEKLGPFIEKLKQ